MFTTLPWFNAAFPLYLAPMAGVSDKIFRQICKRYGADVLVTEFVSAEGVFRRNERTANILISTTANGRSGYSFSALIQLTWHRLPSKWLIGLAPISAIIISAAP